MKFTFRSFRKKYLNKTIFAAGIFACAIGLMGLLVNVYYWHRNKQITQNALSKNAQVVNRPAQINRQPDTLIGRPIRIEIPSLNLQLPVSEGYYNQQTGEWTLSNDRVHHAVITVQPNNKEGNTLIYGHYRPGVFSTLKNIPPNAEVFVVTENNYKFMYRYTKSEIVEPTNTSLFSYSGKPMLTLQTCTGRFMQNRQLFSFDLVDVDKV